jgi:Ca-activated chloride channel family protein
MKILSTLVFGLLLAGSAQAGSWSDLWYRRDQLGQHALQAGDPKRAAELFEDPRRQAYAQLEAGQNAAAATRLQPFTDAESQYNRGNALAKSGDLQAALNAYDGALRHADLDSSLRRDAQHNRDLVARQLQAQKDQQHSSSGQQPPPKSQQDGKAQQDQSKNGSGDSGSASPSQGENNKPDGGKQNGAPATPSSPQPSPGQAEGQQANAGHQEPSGHQEPAGRQEPSPASDSRNGSGRMDDGRVDDGKGAVGDSSKAAVGDSSLPRTEQQLALEQWLRQIPDDPGGLLRRKFMIEHLMKQQQVPP